MDLREVGYDDRDWINLAQERDRWWAYVRAAMNSEFLKSHKYGTLYLGFYPPPSEILIRTLVITYVGLQVNPEKTKYMIMSRDQNPRSYI
ncbi:hypothetical protein ANN_20820 [Periplaneta americana]|uniref:Uncharacterized protein n=1 Tax=Periplaneta americana TaxID=6978 RepID=A0ABQ8SDN4_PERAM|nr:hypothetical protein ANN_20820 [Periplaneta americana]